MSLKIFIDGAEGTTGLQLRQRLLLHPEVKLISINSDKRKDLNHKLEKFSEADLIFLCLPDEESKKTVYEINKQFGLKKLIIDASSAHRIDKDWKYGFPELNINQKSLIRDATRITNPGCYATGALALIRPLIDNNIIDNSATLNINAVSGYTGGGKKLIEYFSNHDKETFVYYSTFLDHKHLKEITRYGLLKINPIFCPSVGAFPQGMAVSLPLHFDWMKEGINGRKIHDIFKDRYRSEEFVSLNPLNSKESLTKEGFLSPEILIGTNYLNISIFSNDLSGQVWLIARLDNLGKGASGAAVQNMNLKFGFNEKLGTKLLK